MLVRLSLSGPKPVTNSSYLGNETYPVDDESVMVIEGVNKKISYQHKKKKRKGGGEKSRYPKCGATIWNRAQKAPTKRGAWRIFFRIHPKALEIPT